MQQPKTIAIFGGSFDPVHQGHIAIAKNIQQAFKFDKFIILPAHQSPLKAAAQATTQHRINMLKLALPKNYILDLQETQRPAPSYTIDSLRIYRDQYGANAVICLIIGLEVFAELYQWHNWQDLLNLCNLLVIKRPQYPIALSTTMQQFLHQHEVFTKNNFLQQSHNHILQFNAGNFPIASHQLRAQLQSGTATAADFPPKVFEYIKNNKLYTDLLHYPI